jgi:hypothetical protein
MTAGRSMLREMALDGGVDFRCRDNFGSCWGAADPPDRLALVGPRLSPNPRADRANSCSIEREWRRLVHSQYRCLVRSIVP